jgi:predicted phosphoribosyltransferase
MRFKDRRDAGQKLAKTLWALDLKSPYVFGMARGGVPVAYEVSRLLKAPLDVLVIRKLGAPYNPEFGFGAIAPDGFFEVNKETVRGLDLTDIEVNEIKKREEQELLRRIKEYRGHRKFPSLADKTVIIVDDGIATGASAKVAVEYLKSKKPKEIILAAPVCAQDSERVLKEEADRVICLSSPPYFSSVGEWYEDFPQTSDEEVINYFSNKK